MRERALFDFVSIAFEKEFEDEHILPNGQKLYLDTKQYVSYTASAEGKSQEEDKWEQHKRIYGEVVATPHKLSDHILSRVDVGFPNPRVHVSGEFIEACVKSKQRGWSRKNYSAASYEPEFKRMSDLEMVAQDGDRAYVNFDAIVPEQRVGTYQGHAIYYIRYNDIICVVRRNNIIMCAEHTLVKPLAQTIEDTKTASGIYTQSVDKPIYLQGILHHVGENTLGLEPQQHIFYDVHADFENTIEGEKYYVIKEEDIMLIVNGKELKPVGNRVLLEKPKELDRTSKGILFGATVRTTESKVVACGDGAAERFQTGTVVHFAKGAGTVVELNNTEYLVVRDTDILVYEEATKD